MSKRLFTMLALLVFASLVLSACAAAVPAAPAPAAEAPAPEASAPEASVNMPKKIAFFVSDLSNVFHQGQFTAAQKYAKKSTAQKSICLTASRTLRP
jgi:ABC-type sugar transport system substrate-binding protein